MIKCIDKEAYFEIYSDQNKKILEKQTEIFWNNGLGDPYPPLAVNKERYNNGDYEESDIDCCDDPVEEFEEFINDSEE